MSPIEDRLFKEEYWKVGFVSLEKKDLYGELPITFLTEKWSELSYTVFAIYGSKNAITEAQVLEYMDNPKRKELFKKYKKKEYSAAAAKRYKDRKKRDTEADSDRDTQA